MEAPPGAPGMPCATSGTPLAGLAPSERASFGHRSGHRSETIRPPAVLFVLQHEFWASRVHWTDRYIHTHTPPCHCLATPPPTCTFLSFIGAVSSCLAGVR